MCGDSMVETQWRMAGASERRVGGGCKVAGKQYGSGSLGPLLSATNKLYSSIQPEVFLLLPASPKDSCLFIPPPFFSRAEHTFLPFLFRK